ncbi:MAG: UbiA family prenyltransferase [Rhodobacteraceae bacterium]|nr:UbiA family prenyltransferase [Paracoccaceae bacterium]
MTDLKPLVLDVDGTFLKTDILFECFWAGLGRHPLQTLAALRHVRHPQRLKETLAGLVDLRVDLLPVNPEVQALAQQCRSAGREVILASASDEALVTRLAAHHGLSGRVFASDGETNLKGERKAQALVEAFGEGGFDYAGNETTDIAIWRHAENALMVGRHAGAERALAREGKSVTMMSEAWRWRDLLRAIRPHQWVKNVLLFLPMIAAHNLESLTFLMVLAGIVAFSAAASSIYVVNDLLDLEADRLHATKYRRPFASGAVPIKAGMITCILLGLIALGMGAALGPSFLGIIVLYMIVSLSYSLQLKRMRWIDIATLAALYTIRVIAGAVASGVYISGYLLVFVFPVFLTLGTVKRLTELTLATSDERLPGRGYGRGDRSDLLNVAGLGVFSSLLIFFLYSFSEHAQELYPTRWLLWVALIPIAAWLIRMVRLGYAGKQDYDPIVFALKDKRGIGLIMITLSLMFYAAGLWQEWFGG